MSIRKSEFPILEFDDKRKSVIMPGHENLNVNLPKRCVYAFLGEYIDKFAEKERAVRVAEFDSITKKYPIYIVDYKGEEVCLVQAPMGSAPSAQILDWLLAYGVKKVISAGSCGVLKDFPENYFLVPKSALRDEGTSYHYLEPSRFVEISEEALKAIEETLGEHNLKYKEVVTWTTDGFYRETAELVRYRMEEGCSVVEMECSALASVAKFRNIIWGEILFTADSLADVAQYDVRSFGLDSFEYALILCLDSVLKL
ncbi:nucleoside phosphorylase [Filifactor villosus]|uniref:Uridine phosphorylase n=1 Tax=Filifactor villosus TaxID=29374 RepID=A0ABV9QM23_9FIRM